MEILCPLWLPLDIGRSLGVDRTTKQPIPIPMFTWFCWQFANSRAILASKSATDPFPDGVLM